MKYLLCCLAVAVVFALCLSGGGPAAPLGIYTRFDHAPSAPVLDSLRHELKSIMSPAGLSFEWRSIAAAEAGETFPDVVVVSFKGVCAAAGDLCVPLPRQIETNALGRTHRTDGHVMRFSDVDCDRIRAFLSDALTALPAQERQAAFGRAVGRVLAHELYHAFARTDRHGSSGVAKARYTVQELMAADFRFEPADLRVLAMAPGGPNSRGSDGLQVAGRSLFAGSGCVYCHGPEGDGTGRGPSLRAVRVSLKVRQLGSRLSDRRSVMYRRARDLGLNWSSLDEANIEGLISYLKTSLE